MSSRDFEIYILVNGLEYSVFSVGLMVSKFEQYLKFVSLVYCFIYVCRYNLVIFKMCVVYVKSCSIADITSEFVYVYTAVVVNTFLYFVVADIAIEFVIFVTFADHSRICNGTYADGIYFCVFFLCRYHG